VPYRGANIPLAILSSLRAFVASGQPSHHDLGCLARGPSASLSMSDGPIGTSNPPAEGVSLRVAASGATAETTVPAVRAMLFHSAVFHPAFFMQGSAHNLFVPLALGRRLCDVGAS